MFSRCVDRRVVWCGLQRYLLIGLLTASLAPAAWAQRVALLVGNASYSSAPLSNPPNDVREMESALTAVGFKVSKVLNANQSQLKRAVRDFGNSARGAEMALLYYSGHGTQVRGENYLIPVGASIDKESDYEIEAVSANAVLAQLREAQPRAAVVVLDACRDNPHVASTKTLTKGLARMDAPTGTMIAFATAPNDVAQDNGLYARVLARNLQRPGLELLDVFRDTTTEVRRQTGGQQVPRVSEVSIDQRIYLAGRASMPSITERVVSHGAPSPLSPEEAMQRTKPSIEFDNEARWLSMVRQSGFLQSQVGKPGYYTVHPGDTLYKIALEAGQNPRDLVRWNNLSGPNVLEVGMVLRIAPPKLD